MATHIGIGFSQNIEAEKAALEAIYQAKVNLGKNKIDLVLVLSTIHYDPQKFIPVFAKTLSKTKIIGCSTAGIILSDSIQTRGLAVLVINSDEIQFGIGSVNNADTLNSRQAGNILAKNCLLDFGKHGRQVFLFLMDGFLENNSLLLRGIQEVLGNVFPIVGAGSCDDFNFAQTFQIFQNKVLTRSTAGLVIGGHMNIGIGSRHGWRPLGKPRIADKVDTNIIRTIDGKPAAFLYEEFFEDEAKNLYSPGLTTRPEISFGQMAILYPLGIYVEESNQYLLRNAIDIQPDGSIVCQGEVPEGAQIHLMIGNKDACKQAAKEAALEAHKDLLGKQAKLIFIIESMARLKLLGRTAVHEIKKIKEVFGSDIPLIGMYAYGEVCPLQTFEKFRKPHFQNESIVILAIS